MISAHWSEIENGYGLIKLLNLSNHYSGYYIKYSALLGSILFTSAAGVMRLWTTNNGTTTIDDYNSLTVMKTSTVMKSSVVTTIGRQYIQKIGRLVLIEITFLNVNDITKDNYPFILPDGFRPKYELYATASSGNSVMSFEIGSDGKIYARQALTANTWYTISKLFFTA